MSLTKTKQLSNSTDQSSVSNKLAQLLSARLSVDLIGLPDDQWQPMCRPATVTVARLHACNALTRAISRRDLGLLLSEAVPLGEVTVVIATSSGDMVTLRVQIDCCELFGNGWYVSRGRILSVEESG